MCCKFWGKIRFAYGVQQKEKSELSHWPILICLNFDISLAIKRANRKVKEGHMGNDYDQENYFFTVLGESSSSMQC